MQRIVKRVGNISRKKLNSSIYQWESVLRLYTEESVLLESQQNSECQFSCQQVERDMSELRTCLTLHEVEHMYVVNLEYTYVHGKSKQQ